MKPLDEVMEKLNAMQLEEAARLKEMAPYLDKKLKEIEKLDKKIEWFEGKIKEIENEKQSQINGMSDLLDLAMVMKHSLKNGYTIRPDNKRKITIKDVPTFLRWLKQNKEPHEVMEFFKDAFKVTKLKAFCDAEANKQREAGVMEPTIDGIDLGEVTFTRYKTERIKKK